MTGRIVLAYPGGAASAGALERWLAAGREVVTVTIDLGQESDLDQVREQALSLGALRAHVLDAREEFARDCLLPALRTQPLHALDPHALATPLVARKLAEIAAIEHADIVMDVDGAGRTLIERQVSDGARVRDLTAHIDLEIQSALPVAINGVPMTIGELFESLALIAGQHGVGRLPQIDAPAAPLLHAAYRALDGRDGVIRFELGNGTLSASSAADAAPHLVNYT
jgi:argininosuccinate synthase